MTNEKAAELLDILKVFDAQDLSEAIEMAKAALREQDATDINDGRKTEAKDWPSYMDLPRKKEDHIREVTKMVGWISVEDRLPEEWRTASGDLVNYLVYTPEFGVDIGNYVKSVKTWLCMGIPCKVTHWMPLPDAPQEV